MKDLFKKIFVGTIISSFAFQNCVFAEPLKGSVTETDGFDARELFTGETDTLDKHDSIKMTVSHVINGSINEAGDEFLAEITEDVGGKKGVILPKGSIVHGKIQQITDPKRLNRDGYIVTEFDYLVTPDGRQIPIQGSLSTKENLAKGTIKNVGQHVGVTLLTGGMGTLMSINLVGLEATIASHGMTAAAGAAVGGAIGLVSMMSKKGKTAQLKPGDEFEIKILGEIDMPVFSENAFKDEDIYLEGLNVELISAKYKKDPFGNDNYIELHVRIDNKSIKDFYPFDIALMDDLKKVYYPSPYAENDVWFSSIKSGQKIIGKMAFSVNNKKNKHWLVFLDRGTKKPIAKYSIESILMANNTKEKKKK